MQILTEQASSSNPRQDIELTVAGKERSNYVAPEHGLCRAFRPPSVPKKAFRCRHQPKDRFECFI